MKGPLNSIISKHFKMNLRWSEGTKLNHTQISALIMFFMVKSFLKFYLFQDRKNALHDELVLSVYSILRMELYFPGLVKIYSKFSALGSLESVANKKGIYLKKNTTRKKILNS